MAKKFKKKYISITIVCFITGLLLVSAIKLYHLVSAGQENSRNETLIETIEELETETTKLEAEITTKRQKINSLQSEQSNKDIDVLQKKLDSLNLMSGNTDVKGPGLKVILDDNKAGADLAKANNPENYTPDYFIIHDKDILYLINELRYLAEAVSVNGQRVTEKSSIRCVGPVIMVDSNRLAPPYELCFIGDGKLLEQALMDSEEYAYLKNKEMPVKYNHVTELKLPAYAGDIINQHAKADK